MHYKASLRNSNGTIAEPSFLPKGQKVRKKLPLSIRLHFLPTKNGQTQEKGSVKKSPTKSIRELKGFRMLFWYDGHVDALW